MKIIGVSASSRKKQSTYFALEQCLNEVKLASDASGKSIDVEIINLADLKIHGCIYSPAVLQSGSPRPAVQSGSDQDNLLICQ
jgi:multimeric flavodoxin WrbA